MTFRPMLACKTPELASLRYPILASYKMDGIRATLIDGVLMSRSMKPIPNRAVQAYYRQHKALLNDMDGELIVGVHDNDVYRRTMSAVMSLHGDPMENVTWHIFDNIKHVAEFKYRLDFVRMRGHSVPRVQAVPHVLLQRPDEVLEFHSNAIAEGYEGLILRDENGKYKQGRSTAAEQGMVKVKMFEDSEARITGWVELMHNANQATINELGLTKRSSHKANKVGTGKMGALQVEDIKSGVAFEIGTGFTDFDRCSHWDNHVGKIIKYKFFAGGVKDKPRFPVFLGFRAVQDM